ncbi:hypothetical protein FD30_GL001477 [Levilactobacillus namurensis DSM 19117]|uniref:DNA phosphorothioation-dependent restriction protein DptG n=1 Tax=Levilactobacillus namurensis DSM 19117 TaxID=1423773 RepID=A0A0R1K7J6_9LACO|nr:DNA phosphorothioation-dependent restriction protein DptG [Levilactobacillus namurensis]KRK76305.1 hypothetical protein FD30_GL001477 [Levilactobacillus namurensis DSM 19117]GEO73674.1 hypothetical protein LNA02_03720 [Levilactobacillus namurensis]
MNEEVNNLCTILHFDTKFKATHDFEGRVLPFFTRNPERIKYTNGFSPVVGVVARVVNDKNAELNQETLNSRDPLIDTRIDKSIVDQLFSPDVYRAMPSSKLLQYLPLSEGKDRTGEILLGKFLVDLLNLKNNQLFIASFSDTEPTNLYERVVFEELETTEVMQKSKPNHFEFYDGGYYENLFKQDVQRLMQDRGYYYDHISELLRFYYFIYVSQTIVRISDTEANNTITPLYFALENEPVSRSRQAVRAGYSMVYQHGQDLLTDVDVLNYLNALIPDENHFFWKNQILASDFDYHHVLYDNLMEFLPLFARNLDAAITEGVNFNFPDLKTAVDGLRRLLARRSDANRATSARYAKSFEEIAQQGFVRQHGRLGRTFSLSNHMVLLLTTAIVGKGKLPLNFVFEELKKRGVYFDRMTRNRIIALFEQANILEKLSDSGDAQYVRGIL